MSIRKQIIASLALRLQPYGFNKDGNNYFRREINHVKQAIFLQASRHGDVIFPEMLVTFADLNPMRENKHPNSHIRARISGYYHPLGDPSSNVEWSLPLQVFDESNRDLNKELDDAVSTALNWFNDFSELQSTIEKMMHVKWALQVHRYELFADLGKPVPMPIEN